MLDRLLMTALAMLAACDTTPSGAPITLAVGSTACDEAGDAGGHTLASDECVIQAPPGQSCADACDGEDVAGVFDFTCDANGTNAANGPNPGCTVEPPRSYRCVCDYTESATGDGGSSDGGATDGAPTDGAPTDGAPTDGGAFVDVGSPDANAPDAESDAGEPDAGDPTDSGTSTGCDNDDQSHLPDVDLPANPSRLRIAGSGKVAYVGCSQTRESTLGYTDLGGSRTATGSFGGCSIDEWNDPSSGCRTTLQSWITSPAGLGASSASEITDAMLQICIRSVREGTYSYEDVVRTAEYLEETFPNVERVYVYGLEFFEENDDPGYDSTCHGATLTQQDLSRQWADDLATRNDGDTQQDGLRAAYLSVNNLGYLDPTTTFSTPPNDDFCHPGHLDTERCPTSPSDDGFCDEGNGRLIMGETLCFLLGDCDVDLCEAAPLSAP